MSVKRHGLAIGLERTGEEFFLSLRVHGKLTHEDYQSLVPMLESAMEGIETPEIDVFLDARELEGWEARAAWDDLKLGVKHGREFRRIAILGNRRWQELAAKVGSWFIGGEARYFEDEGEAMAWLESSP
ncbi:hypothetical protein AUP74_00571 [Microbulbifer aggregans]|uniref:STAS/SEC14 domain-containing protein n=1 Tax=Microbulbifer aggregans TaxID=1769779 RepID=A0A1C9W4H1_9GAMM|nr:STAS/SEC14 domain-containing protein [Microbulbifer aggregans]AOS96041.1 hypothetical protein AUP74_00571 [Microbulbifer aggregans]